MIRPSDTAMSLLVATAFVAAGCVFFHSGEQYPDTVEEGFVSLFNGRDLSGWEGATAMYGVDESEPGVLHCFPERRIPVGERPDLRTTRSFTNFVLRFEFCMSENANNGLGIRMEPGKDAAYFGMCELQLLDDGGREYIDAATGADRQEPWRYAASVWGVVPSRRDNPAGREAGFAGGGSYMRKHGTWNFEEVRVVGSEVEVLLNGALVTKADLSKWRGDGDTPDGAPHPGIHRTEGPIGWLGHGYNVKWRNIRVLDLPSDATLESVRSAVSVPSPATPPKGFSEVSVDRLQDWLSLAAVRGVRCVDVWSDWRLLDEQCGIDPALASAARRTGDWNRMRMRIAGGKVWLALNGVKIVDGAACESCGTWSCPSLLLGLVGLARDGAPIEWRNVFVREAGK